MTDAEKAFDEAREHLARTVEETTARLQALAAEPATVENFEEMVALLAPLRLARIRAHDAAEAMKRDNQEHDENV
jgi:hypothetical protein